MRTLSNLNPDECGVVKTVTCEHSMKRRLYDLGIVPGTKITCIYRAPLGDPKAYFVRGALIALRCDDSSNIILE